MTHKSNVRLIETVVRSLCERIDTPRSLAVWMAFKYDQKSLLDLPNPRPLDYESAYCFGNDYFITSLLSKYKGLMTGIDTRAVALEGWRASEVKCNATNRYLRDLHNSDFSDKETFRLLKVISLAKRKIEQVLGPLKVAVVLDHSRWGPGATFDMRRSSGLDQKISRKITVTSPALRYLKAVMEADPNWAEAVIGVKPEGPYSLTRSCFQIVRGNRFLTVPKSAKTDRCIAAEPTGNGFLQQGVGRYIRARLAKFGVRLDDQSINQKLAAQAVNLGLATLDLKAASDTISRELVHTLLPLDWAFFLDDLRSKESRVAGEWVYLEKFSSMGNAFTFELETLIFWALCASVMECEEVRGKLAVYGDDLIVPSCIANTLIATLERCGFTTNQEKSFIEGPFRESCGEHFFNGCNVTPVYQKSVVDSLPELIRLANRLVRYSIRVYDTWRASVVRSAHRAILDFSKDLLNGRTLPAIPLGVDGDDGFLVPRSWLPNCCPNRGILCHVLVFKEEQRRGNETALLAYKLRHPVYSASLTTGRQTVSRGVGRWVHRKRWIHPVAI
jgi:hypothetical protein